jgi:hypothetical protein
MSEDVVVHDFNYPHAVHVLDYGEGWEIDLHGWGGDRNKDRWPRGTGRFNLPRKGDYLKLRTDDPEDPSYYRVDEIYKYGDPPDMWRATASFMPGSKMKPILYRLEKGDDWWWWDYWR